ncbi:nuclear cap-binding protein subunit 1-like [Falco rusticolus]|uniref:nuclear cap-binding protein subunit 1-like n=1 Tax=Falco rusticolus TaxID=120794 RepID=UPI0018865F77|nr:nuclear cap-binding protein subunit 1-like [Falco rusticolus]
MSRRRRHSDESDGQTRKRRRTSEPSEIEERLESLICRVGEKSTSSLESNLEGLAGVLEADLPNYKSKILRILCAVARLLPEKLTIYTTLVGLLNARNYNFGGEFVEAMIRQLKECLKVNMYNEAEYLVRFLSDLVNCHVIAAPSMVAMFENFVSVTQEEDIPQVRCDWYVFAFLSSLPWVGKELYEKKDAEIDRLLSHTESYLKRRQKIHVPMLQVWIADKPHPQEEYLDCLWAQIQKLKKDHWQERHILRPYLAFDSILCEALQHNLPPFTPPPHTEDSVYPVPRVIFRMFDYTDDPEVSYKNVFQPSSHLAFVANKRFHEVFKVLAESDEGKLHVLRVVYEVWKNHPQMIAVLVDKMIRTQIVDCAAVANWIFSSELAHDFTRFYVWEILHSTIRKMNKHVLKIHKELDETKARLARQHKRRESDEHDDNNDQSSDREDGPLEEQIERLQERVESAQSEQKNLFLVIFQRFIMLLTEHLVRCETGGIDVFTPWYKSCIERLQQIFLQHHQIIQQYMVTLENLLFTAELDHHILAVFQQFCALQA